MALPSFSLKMLVKKSCSFCQWRFLCEGIWAARQAPPKWVHSWRCSRRRHPGLGFVGEVRHKFADLYTTSKQPTLSVAGCGGLFAIKISRTCRSIADVAVWDPQEPRRHGCHKWHDHMIHLWQVSTSCHWGWKSVALKLLGHPRWQWWNDHREK